MVVLQMAFQGGSSHLLTPKSGKFLMLNFFVKGKESEFLFLSCLVSLHSHMDNKHGHSLRKESRVCGLCKSSSAFLLMSAGKIYSQLQEYLEPKSQFPLTGELEFLLQK